MVGVPEPLGEYAPRRFGLWPPGNSINWTLLMNCATCAILPGTDLSNCVATASGNIALESMLNFESVLHGPMLDLKKSRSSITIEWLCNETRSLRWYAFLLIVPLLTQVRCCWRNF